MKIKKVDDKPMVIHTKKKAKIHTHEPKKASIKASNIYTVDRSPKIKGSKIATTENKKFRRSTIHPVDNAKKGMFRQYRAALKESKQSIKTKNSSIKVAGAAGAQTALSQMEGGEEVRDAANIAYVATRPVTGTASKGAELFRRKTLAEKRKRIKKVESGKKLAKKTAKEIAKTAAKEASKETAKAAAKEGAKVAAKVGTTVAGTAAGAETGPYAPLIGMAVGKAVGDKLDKMDAKRNSRNRKIKFFLDKMKAEGEQQDSFAKLVKDLFINKMALPIKKIMVAVGGFLLVLVLLIAVTVLPVVAVIAILYNSPFAFFLPPLESGDTVTTVTSAYVSEFNRDINTLANEHTGYDTGQIVYVDFEGESAGNFNDIVTIYMVKYGVGDTATVMNDTSKSKLKEVFDDMCSYTTSSGSETTENEDGSTTTQTVLYVNVKLKTCYDMITEYNFDSDQIELVEEMMRMFGSTSGVTPQSSLTQAEVDAILQGITDPAQRTVVSYALTKVGYPYSQQYRDTGNYYDCSSLGEVVSYATIVNYQKLISLKTADLAFGEKPNITVADDTEQTIIDDIVIHTELIDKLYTSALDISRYGDSIIMLTSDGNVDVVSPALWFPIVDEINIRRFKYHVFGFIYIIDSKAETYGLKVQIHNPDNPTECEERNYLLSGKSMSDFEIVKDLTKKKEMKIQTHLNSCPVYRISNLITSDRIFGLDDYRSVDSLISELMVRISQISKVLDKFAQPSMTGPQSALQMDEITGQWILKIGDYYPRNDDKDPKPEYLTWDAGMEANFKQIELIINQLYTISEMGSALLGDLSNKTGDVPSGSALRRLMMSPLAKARRITNRYDTPVKKLLSVLASMQGVDIKPSEITIKWNDGLPADPAEEAEIANVRTGGKPTLSQYTAIQRMDNMSSSDVDTELEMIRADTLENSAGSVPPLEPETVLEEEF